MTSPNRNVIIANEQPREGVRLRGSSLMKPCAKVQRQNESRIDITYTIYLRSLGKQSVLFSREA